MVSVYTVYIIYIVSIINYYYSLTSFDGIYHHYIIHIRSERRLTFDVWRLVVVYQHDNSSCCHLWWQCWQLTTDNMQQELLLHFTTTTYFCHQRWHWSVECQLNITNIVPTNVAMLPSPLLSNAALAEWDTIEWSALARNEAVVVVVFIVIITILSSVARLSSSKLWKLLIVVLPLIDKASRGGFNGGTIEKSSGHFLTALVTEGQFLALQMVKLSSLHDEGRPADVFYHHRRDTLVTALPMAVLSLILAFHNIDTFFAWLFGGKLFGSLSFTPVCVVSSPHRTNPEHHHHTPYIGTLPTLSSSRP